MKVFFFPIISISICFCVGIILFFYTSMSWFAILGFLSICFIGYFLNSKTFDNNKKIKTIILLSAWIFIGSFTTKIHNVIDYKNHYTNYLKSHQNNTATITLSERLKSSDKNYKFYASISSINNKKTIGRLIIYIPKTDSINYTIGDNLLINSTFNEILEPKNPYEFSYSGYLKKQHIYHQLFLKKDFTKIGIDRNLDYYIDNLRESLITSFTIHKFNDETQQFINAFIFGQRQEISTKLNENYTNAGVVHILAISGLHIAILYGMVLYVFKTLRWGYGKRFLKLLISILFLWTFALITGMSASVVRSVTMFTIMAIAMTFDKNQNIYNSMAISFLVILLFKPYFIFDVGFQLSYLSVFIIIVCNPLYKKLHFTRFKIVHLTMDLLSISLCAQLFLLPLLIYYFHQFPTLFLIANFIVIPLSNLILYGLVLLLILNFILPNVAVFVGKIIEYLITYLNDYIAFIASFKKFTLQNIPFNTILLIASYLVITLLLLNIFKTNFKRLTALLTSIIILQLGFIYSIEQRKDWSEFIVWNQNKNTIITNETKNKIEIYTNNDLQIERFVNNISQNNFDKEIAINTLPNYFVIGNEKILLINSNDFVYTNILPDIIILANSPKINLDRVLNTFNPKILVADASNYKSYISNWRLSCFKKNIPFHTTYEMGYYNIKN